MTKLLNKVQGRRRRTEADQFFREAYPLPVAGIATAALFIGDVAVVLAAIAAIG